MLATMNEGSWEVTASSLMPLLIQGLFIQSYQSLRNLGSTYEHLHFPDEKTRAQRDQEKKINMIHSGRGAGYSCICYNSRLNYY